MPKEVATTSSSMREKVFSMFKSKSNDNKRDSDESEAGPSKHQVTEVFPSIQKSFNTDITSWGISMYNNIQVVYNVNITREPMNIIKDEPSMSKYVENVSILNGMQSIDQIEVKELLRTTNCGNVSNTFNGDAHNNSIHVSNTFIFTRESTSDRNYESCIFVQKTVTKEVFPYDKDIIELIWKKLSFEDKKDCTLVCNRFNDIISDMNCFRLVVKSESKVSKSKRSDLQIIPTLSRHYKTLVVQGYRCRKLTSAMHEMLKHLSPSVTDLTLDNCEYDIIALSKFLSELPILESLKLNVFITKDSIDDLSEKDLPNLLRLKEFNIKVNDNKLIEIFDITKTASNIQSLTLFGALFDIDIINYVVQYEKLTSLSLNNCIVGEPSPSYKSNLGSLHFDSSVKQPSISKQSNKSINYLTLDDCVYDVIAFSKFLRELCELKSLKLNGILQEN